MQSSMQVLTTLVRMVLLRPTFQNGLQVFDKHIAKFTEGYMTDIKDIHAISNNCITHIIRYNKDTLLLATEMGLNIFDIKTKLTGSDILVSRCAPVFYEIQ